MDSLFDGRRGRLIGGGLAIAALVTLIIVNQLFWLGARNARAEAIVIADSETLYVPDVRTTRLIGMGYDQAMADLLWLRTLNYFARHFSGDKDYAWLEHFVDQIIELDPEFRAVYHWAGANVLYGSNFTNENVRLSNRFYKEAMEQFPEDFEAPYRLGLNYYVELRSDDPEERKRYREIGLSYLELAANRPGAPDKVRSLVAAISSRLGKDHVALQYLIDLYLQATDEATREQLKARIETLRAAQDQGALVEAATRFEDDRRAVVPYVRPALFALMGEPPAAERHDVDWRDLLPDVRVDVTTP